MTGLMFGKTTTRLIGFAILFAVFTSGSIAAAQNATLVFVNNTSVAVKGFWLDGQNNAQEYFTVEPKTQVEQPTFTGHTWIIRDNAGNELQRVTARGGRQLINVVVRRPKADPQQNNPPKGNGSQQGGGGQQDANAQGRKSIPGGSRATLQITNNSKQAVNVFWIDFEGNEKPYGRLQPGESRRQITGLKNVWVIKDAGSGQELTAVNVVQQSQTLQLPINGRGTPGGGQGNSGGSQGGGNQGNPSGNNIGGNNVGGNNGEQAQGPTYWLGIPAREGGRTNRLVTQFKTRVPDDVVQKLILNQTNAAPGFATFQQDAGGQKRTFYKHNIGWNDDTIGRGTLTFVSGQGMGQTWVNVKTNGAYQAFAKQLTSIRKDFTPGSGWYTAETLVVRVDGTNPPNFSLRIGDEQTTNNSGTSGTTGNTGTTGTTGSGGGGPAQPAGPGPVDVASSSPIPNLIGVANSDGSIDVVWQRSDGRTLYSTYSGQNFQNATHTPLNGLLSLLGGFTKDSAGNGYVLSARREHSKAGAGAQPRLRRRGVLQIHKIPAGQRSIQLLADLNAPSQAGTKQGTFYTKWGIFNPILHSGNVSTNAQLLQGGGVLAASFIHNIPSPNIGGDGLLHNTGCLLAVDTNGNAVYTNGAENHAMETRLFYDGSRFLRAQVGDQGILVSELEQQNGKWVWSDDKMGAGAAREGLKHLYRLGNFASMNSGPALLYTYVENGWAFGPQEREWEADANGAALYLMTLPQDISALPAFNWRDRSTGPGISQRQLASPPTGSNFVRPRLIDLKNGRLVVLYEQWRGGWNAAYQKTFGMIIDKSGNRIAGPKELSGIRTQRGNVGLHLANRSRAGFLAGDKSGGAIKLHTIDGNLNTQTFSLRGN
ncbi:von Hippel-Lindau disease tumor suppressor protein [Stratiformator vulcanicus]|uniref:von Hippel-Lindau disease tumor suppressor protein n=2 Tax=Stratiformator vulcanicus TaxID=2527980 RepID=A0A517QXD5_9PLAN|nr:von Hippel-Lindau disease tumor suppressor protein [Stratiformator vulcanicus]